MRHMRVWCRASPSQGVACTGGGGGCMMCSCVRKTENWGREKRAQPWRARAEAMVLHGALVRALHAVKRGMRVLRQAISLSHLAEKHFGVHPFQGT